MDNWSIIKLLGGFSVIVIGTITFVINYFKKLLERSVDYKYEKKLENVRGDIEKNNSFLNSVVQNYFSSSQKILDKKIQAYEELWHSMIAIKSLIPSGINLIFQLFSDTEINDRDFYNKLQSNADRLGLGERLNSYNLDVEMKKLLTTEDILMKFQPYITDKVYKLFSVYRNLIARITHEFLFDYQNKKIFNWKNDKAVEALLNIVLTEKELQYIYSLEYGTLPNLLDLLEYKFVQDFKKKLDIKDSTNDTISHLKDIEKIVDISRGGTFTKS